MRTFEDGTTRRVGRVIALVLALAAALLATLAPAATATPAETRLADSARAYSYTGSDTFRFWDGTGRYVWAQGTMDWYRDGWLAPVYRGQVRNDRSGYVVLNTTGCLHVKVTFRNVVGSLSWPPSGTIGTTTDGWYRKCGASGTSVSLGGVAYASRTLIGATVCTGYSRSTSDIRRYDACWRMSN